MTVYCVWVCVYAYKIDEMSLNNNIDVWNVNKYISRPIPLIDYEIICLRITWAYVIINQIQKRNIAISYRNCAYSIHIHIGLLLFALPLLTCGAKKKHAPTFDEYTTEY